MELTAESNDFLHRLKEYGMSKKKIAVQSNGIRYCSDLDNSFHEAIGEERVLVTR